MFDLRLASADTRERGRTHPNFIRLAVACHYLSRKKRGNRFQFANWLACVQSVGTPNAIIMAEWILNDVVFYSSSFCEPFENLQMINKCCENHFRTTIWKNSSSCSNNSNTFFQLQLIKHNPFMIHLSPWKLEIF